MATRKSLVAKKSSFSAQNGDEKRARRQKHDFLTSKRRRERGSSPKNQVFWPKIATRKGLVAKKWGFPPQNDDENESRRQKNGVSRLKMTTRKSLVAKKSSFPPQNGDENRARRQKREFLGSK
ncbi:hypothetical protein [Caldifermentibacillus hisashii]|uniref:hypothetical protein n=1 Tax=Caldifermentibacillus hisashii TaxID=996558 RepID=UPI003D1CB88F